MTRILAIFIIATAAFVAGAYYGQTDLDCKGNVAQIHELQEQNESLRTENARLLSQTDLIKEALQANIVAMARIQKIPGGAASSAGELKSIIEEQQQLLHQADSE